jgi:NADH:ubiquinone reductase (H+-translocating)
MAETDQKNALPHVVIVGAGFAGLRAAKGLCKAPVRVTVIDRVNHHLFQPLLYQVATGALSFADIAAPIRLILRDQHNVEVIQIEVTEVDVPGKRVILADGEVSYDFLILSAGATHAYFGHDDWAQFAPGLKSLSDAMEVRRRVFSAFEIAERETDEARRRAWMTFVVVGGGPTGVELSGALAEVSRSTLAREFRHIDPREARVVLMQGGSRILLAFDESLSAAAYRQLNSLGVEVQTGRHVTVIDEQGVAIGPDRIEARTVLWAAGVAASPLARSLGVPLDNAGRVIVGPDLTIPERDDVFVIGDLAHLEQGGTLVPGVAPAAMQQGDHAARSILSSLRGKPRKPFHYVNKGMLATIGRRRAVAHVGPIKATGFPAWLMWIFIHILFLVGFRRKLSVFVAWTWSFFTYQRGSRVMIETVKKAPAKENTSVPLAAWRTTVPSARNESL